MSISTDPGEEMEKLLETESASNPELKRRLAVLRVQTETLKTVIRQGQFCFEHHYGCPRCGAKP